jgi:hypothetical protein
MGGIYKELEVKIKKLRLLKYSLFREQFWLRDK